MKILHTFFAFLFLTQFLVAQKATVTEEFRAFELIRFLILYLLLIAKSRVPAYC